MGERIREAGGLQGLLAPQLVPQESPRDSRDMWLQSLQAEGSSKSVGDRGADEWGMPWGWVNFNKAMKYSNIWYKINKRRGIFFRTDNWNVLLPYIYILIYMYWKCLSYFSKIFVWFLNGTQTVKEINISRNVVFHVIYLVMSNNVVSSLVSVFKWGSLWFSPTIPEFSIKMKCYF